MSLFTSKVSVLLLATATAVYNGEHACVCTSTCIEGVASLKLKPRIATGTPVAPGTPVVTATPVASGATLVPGTDPILTATRVVPFFYADVANQLKTANSMDKDIVKPEELFTICPDLSDADQVISCFLNSPLFSALLDIAKEQAAEDNRWWMAKAAEDNRMAPATADAEAADLARAIMMSRQEQYGETEAALSQGSTDDEAAELAQGAAATGGAVIHPHESSTYTRQRRKLLSLRRFQLPVRGGSSKYNRLRGPRHQVEPSSSPPRRDTSSSGPSDLAQLNLMGSLDERRAQLATLLA